MTDKINATSPGQTPLTEEDLKGLIPSHITLKRELNEYEARNIEEASKKYLLGKGSKLDVSDYLDLKTLHRSMFAEVWKWAGAFRVYDTQGIGVDRHQIQAHVKNACDDFKHWIDNKTYHPSEAAIRFHHRLIYIHPFPNGNGRHGRFVADLFIHQNGLEPLTWGGVNLVSSGQARDAYLLAMKKADPCAGADFSALIDFARK